ncbi:MAG: hypothetical protein JJE34_02790 [Alphaproteobacteria bacterium]|nr:hypothetical protein [Alphaproteobacteria bacterium]
MQAIFKFPFVMGEKISIQLGRAPILSVTLARAALLVAWAHELNYIGHIYTDMRPMTEWTIMSYMGWNALCIVGLLLTPRWEITLRPLILLIDFVVCATLVVLLRPIELPAILCCLLLLWSARERLGISIAAIAALCFIMAFIFRNHYEPLAQIYSLQLASDYTDSASIFIGSLIALAVIGSHLYQDQVKSWGDQLQAAGGNLNAPPIEFLLNQVATFFNARTVHFIWEDMNDVAIRYSSLNEGELSFPRIADDGMHPLLHPRVRDASFLFASHSEQLFYRNSFGALKFSNAPEFIDTINEALQFRRGASFAINAGALRGRFFIERRHGWSPHLLGQCDYAADCVDVFFERSCFLEAWRNRTFAEARLALSGDLHDSILQTLAAMRMRLSALMPKVSKILPAEQTEDLKTLQELIIAEQSRLRQLLNESKRNNGVTQNLAEGLSSCAKMLSSQWNIDCNVYVDQPEVDIDRSTAIEVEFLVREAVANAVQHASARKVTIAAAVQGDALLMAFRNDSNNGSNSGALPETPAPIDGIQSQSLTRRLSLLGGTAYFDNVNDKSLLSIRIPLNLTEKRV